MNIKQGDKVTWTHSSSNGDSFRFRTRRGVVLAIEPNNAFIKMRNGRKAHVHPEKLRKEGEKTELTQMFEDMP